MPPNDKDDSGLIPSSKWFTNLIEAVKQPLGMFTLGMLLFFVMAFVGRVAEDRLLPEVALGGLFGCFLAFVGILIYDPTRLYKPAVPKPNEATGFKELDPLSAVKSAVKSEVWDGILGIDKPPPGMDEWYRKLRPTLHQASFYTVPTYYLDTDLRILDFNIAFELMFRDITGNLRGRHVNWWIAKLQNSEAVFDHGIRFTERVEREGRFPFVDLEPIVYDSPDFGRVAFVKVASQLHNQDGRLQGWAVALMIRTLSAWDDFEKELETKLFQDKLWSVYAGPYDRILPNFPPYLQLISDVVAVLPRANVCVGDFGAGTGNVTNELARRGHRVYAVENNIGMLDRLATKIKGSPNVNLVKASVEHLDGFKDEIFDGVTMVNVLYALDDPLGCLREIHRVLKPGGVIGLSTTHRNTNLDELLQAIKEHGSTGTNGQFQADYDILERVNREIEKTIARRHTCEEYRKWIETAGFQVIHQVDSTYHNAVMLIHARKLG